MILLQLLSTLFYRAIQLLPNSLLRKISASLPVWQDSFVPATWFEPMPNIPKAGIIEPTPDYYFSGDMPIMLNLILLRSSAQVTGTITLIEIRPKDATWDHETFRVKPDDSSILNRFSVGVDNCIEVETPVGTDQSKLKVGDRITVWGDYVLQTAWGYPEIHFAKAWKVLKP